MTQALVLGFDPVNFEPTPIQKKSKLFNTTCPLILKHWLWVGGFCIIISSFPTHVFKWNKSIYDCELNEAKACIFFYYYPVSNPFDYCRLTLSTIKLIKN